MYNTTFSVTEDDLKLPHLSFFLLHMIPRASVFSHTCYGKATKFFEDNGYK